MKKGKEKLKILFAFIIGGIVTSSVVYAATLYSATEVSYDNSSSGTSKTDIQGAVDELYELSKTHCPDGYTCQETTGAELLISKANDIIVPTYSTGNTGEMYTFNHEATAQTLSKIDYRYIGSVPNNYIIFNNETWRIIGVFDKRIKIIRDESISSISWDYKQNGVGSSTTNWGSNDWSDSQLMYMLNPTTYALKSGYRLDGNYIKDANGNIIYQVGCLPASIASGATSYSCTVNTWSLNSEALSQIDTVTYYLGGTSWDETIHHGSTMDIYTRERGTGISSVRPITWEGQVGLLYASDYGYAYALGVNDTCYNDLWACEVGASTSWLYKSEYVQWLFTPREASEDYVFYITEEGHLYHGAFPEGLNVTYGVRPVAYLKPEIKLIGNGTMDFPYTIVSDS